jgi:hypothetical protein
MSDRTPEPAQLDAPGQNYRTAEPANPFASTLTWFWSGGLVLGLILVIIGFVQANDSSYYATGLEGLAALTFGGALVSIGTMAGFVHLGVNAVLWKLARLAK